MWAKRERESGFLQIANTLPTFYWYGVYEPRFDHCFVRQFLNPALYKRSSWTKPKAWNEIRNPGLGSLIWNQRQIIHIDEYHGLYITLKGTVAGDGFCHIPSCLQGWFEIWKVFYLVENSPLNFMCIGPIGVFSIYDKSSGRFLLICLNDLSVFFMHPKILLSHSETIKHFWHILKK